METPVKVFSLAEANDLVPTVSGFTAETVEELERIRALYRVDSGAPEVEVPESALLDIQRTLQQWADKVSTLGVSPKGYFTVDFQSIDPELLYCWTYGEDQIAYTHKVWENFAHRRPLTSGPEGSSDHSQWVH